jgi:hypothetical protein
VRIGIAKKVSEQLASTRFRLLIPSRNIQKYTYQLGKGDITIFPKHSVSLEEAACWEGPTIWDVCDDHFEDKWSDYYLTMPKLVTQITCTTDVLKERIKHFTGKDAVVISDPLEYGTQPPWIGTKKLFWYGHQSNMAPVLDLNLKRHELMLVSNLQAEGVIPWSHDAMQKGFKWCDAVILPVGGSGAKKDAKSPNRMTEAINAGRFVIANDMPAYRGYGMYLGDIEEGLQWLKRNQREALQLLQKAQELVIQKHSPKVIAGQWEALLDSIWDAGKSSGPDSSTSI